MILSSFEKKGHVLCCVSSLVWGGKFDYFTAHMYLRFNAFFI